MALTIKRNGERRVFISHSSARPYPIAYAAGRYCFRPALPNPPVEVVYKARRVDVFGQFVTVAA